MAKVKKLGEVKGEDALDLMADLLLPFSEISADEKLVKLLRSKKLVQAISLALKTHKESVYEILNCLLEEGDAKDLSAIEIPVILLDILNDAELVNLFQSQEQSLEDASSVPAPENTEAN